MPTITEPNLKAYKQGFHSMNSDSPYYSYGKNPYTVDSELYFFFEAGAACRKRQQNALNSAAEYWY